MTQGMRYLWWVGVITAGGFCALDFLTSVRGFRIIFPQTSEEDPIAVFTPVFFALFCIVFNGGSGMMFRMYVQEGFTRFSTAVTCLLWIFFLSYDVVSSFVGLLDTFSGIRVESFGSIMRAFNQLNPLAMFVLTVLAFILSLAPFLFCMFYELANSKKS